MILDVPLPGIAGWDEVQADPNVWHVRFMQVPGFAEKLVTGRQADYFEYFFHFAKFTPTEKAHFVNAYRTPAQLHSAFEMYRAFPANAEFNRAQHNTIDVPILYAAGDGSPFAKIVSKIADGLRANGCTNVETTFIRDAVHYLVEDQPDRVAELIEQFGVR
jgi:pimeloyl-ACP methyl ester carboxylesterase